MRMVLRAGTDPFIEFEGRNSSFIGALKSGASVLKKFCPSTARY